MRPILVLLTAFVLVLGLLGSGRPADLLATSASGYQPLAGSDSLAIELRALLDDSVARASSRPGPAVRAFYRRRAFAPAWCASSQPGAAGRVALALLAQAGDYGLVPARYQATALLALADTLARPGSAGNLLARQVRFEVLLTKNLLRFVGHLRRGQLHGQTPSPLESQANPFEPAAWVTSALAAPDFGAALLRCQPPQREYQQLQRALARWRRAPAGSDSVARQRRAQQLALTLERWRWSAIPETDYVLVNLPAYALEVVRGGRVLQTHRLVIGSPGRPTPTLSSRLTSFTIAPEWRVPHSIATKEILPHLRAGTRATSEHNFLADNNYTLYNASGQLVNPATVNWPAVTAQNFPYTIRQSAGCENALGNIIFRFANPYSVYLHATSNTADFRKPYRALGHGCMRMERPMQLAAYLLGTDSTRAALPTEAECEAAPKSRTLTLRHPMPLHVAYATCAVVAGQLQFYPDVYGRDETLRRQIFGR
jgi:murein L,D-transpeptidase YcbB/YkuD